MTRAQPPKGISSLWIAAGVLVLVAMVLLADARPWLRGDPSAGLTIAIGFNALLAVGVVVLVVRRLRR